MIFYVGLHMVNHAHLHDTVFISANRLWTRRSPFVVNNWIMDSGAFSEISRYGHYRHSVQEYADLINRVKTWGNLECAVSQDMMCEPWIIERTGLSVEEHQRISIERYDELITLTDVPIMPVLQGFEVGDYIHHLHQYSDRLITGMRVGVGSVCKRNGKPVQVENILLAIKRVRPDLRLHGFGLKSTALQNDMIRSLLFSTDSMAWSYRARKAGGNPNGATEAVEFAGLINTMPIQGMLAAL